MARLTVWNQGQVGRREPDVGEPAVGEPTAGRPSVTGARPGSHRPAHAGFLGWWLHLARGRRPKHPASSTMRTLIVATSNPGKLREVAEFLSDVPGVTIGSLRDVSSVPHVEEDGITFRQNAIKKAVEYSRAFAGLVLADDSGLCVDALGGEPGVRSARYGGAGLDDVGRCRYLLERLKDVPDEARGARFECAVALAEKGRLIATFSGTVDGGLLRAMRGTNGFGYDPIFFHPPSRRTFAELTTEEKAAVSHRGRALAALRTYLHEHPELLT